MLQKALQQTAILLMPCPYILAQKVLPKLRKRECPILSKRTAREVEEAASEYPEEFYPTEIPRGQALPTEG